MKTLAERATVLLRGLGDTPEEIAAMLLGAGYKGRRDDPAYCPCGSCLRDHLNERIGVGEIGVFTLGGDYQEAMMAEPVRAFVRRFDAGEFPELVEEG